MTAHGHVYLCNVPDSFDPVAFCRGPLLPHTEGYDFEIVQ
jgi:hypothetical protein